MTPNIVAIIPARMSSSRFPGKPLADILGMSMIGHVYLRTRMSPLLADTYVATCDREIYEHVESIGGKAVMTADVHEHCSDRCAEAMLKVEEATGKRIDILVMVQGDEPLVTPDMVGDAVAPLLEDETLNVVNLVAPLNSVEEFENPNEVKVVVGANGDALYFSREPIPSRKKGVSEVPMLKQVCVIPFRRDFLLEFNATPETPLEHIESVDMLRVLETGGRVRMVPCDKITIGVDTPEDLEVARQLMAGDPLAKEYLG